MIKLAAVGCGEAMQAHYDRLRTLDKLQFVGHCDTVLERAESAAAAFGGEPFDNHEAMFAKTNPDAVFICVPPYAHGNIELDAADRGIHFFVESPIALDRRTADRVAAAVRRRKLITSVGYCIRYCDTVAKARRHLKGKAVSLVTGRDLSGLPDAWWWRRRSHSGGQFVTQTGHVVDLLRYLCGEVSEVFAVTSGGCMNQVENYDIDDSCAVIMRLKNGATATIAATCVNGREDKTGLDIITPEATIYLDGTTLCIEEGETCTTHRSSGDMLLAQDAAFIESVRSGRRNRVKSPYSDARKTLCLTLAASESAASGLPAQP